MRGEIREQLLEKAVDDKIPCALAREIAEDVGAGYKEVGAAADELGIKIHRCELGCF
jgi:LAO/AO transport system kinase